MAISTIKKTAVENVVNHFEAINGIGKIKVKIPTADVLTLGAAVDISAYPPVGYAWKVLGMSNEIKTYGGAAYATNTTLQVQAKTGNKPQFQDAIFLTKTSAGITEGSKVAPAAVGDKQLVVDQPLQLVVSGGNPATGTSDAYVYLDVTLVDLRDNY